MVVYNSKVPAAMAAVCMHMSGLSIQAAAEHQNRGCYPMHRYAHAHMSMCINDIRVTNILCTATHSRLVHDKTRVQKKEIRGAIIYRYDKGIRDQQRIQSAFACMVCCPLLRGSADSCCRGVPVLLGSK